MYVYSMALGTLGQVKVGYTNDIARRAGEHGRKYNCRKQVQVLTALEFTSKATVENLESQLIQKMIEAGLEMVIDPQGGKTERFYINPNISEIEVTVRKKTYKVKVS